MECGAPTVKILLSLVMLTRVLSNPQVPNRPPRSCLVDEAATDHGFVAFRNQLEQIVDARDAEGLLALSFDDIVVSQSQASGKVAFRENYRPSDKRSQLWGELGAVLRLGGRFVEPGVFCAPYVSCPTPDGEVSELGVVLGVDVPAFELPSVKSRTVARLSCAVVRIAGKDLPPEPPRVVPPDWFSVFVQGRWAYLEWKNLRLPGDYRAYFEKRNGQWKMTMFLAGD